MRRTIFIAFFCCLALWLPAAGPVRSAGFSGMEIQPAHLDVDTFFTGGRVTITGRVPAASEVAIEITGPAVNAQYDIKGRVGPFWMTRQNVHLENAPALYALLTPAGSEWEQRLPGLGLGYAKMKSDLHISQTDLPNEDILKMFMNLKESEGLYSENSGAVSYTDERDGSKEFRAVYDFPSSTAPGNYAITATLLENGRAAGEVSKEFKVRETGFVKLIDEMATNQRLAYGILAVLIALFAGGIMGVLFKGGGSH